MFCPECGQPLPDPQAPFCPSCGSRIVLPPDAPILAQEPPQPPERTPSKRSTAALILGTGTLLFGMLTLICRMLHTDIRVLGAVSVVTFFLAPLSCIFGLSGIVTRIAHPEKGGLCRAIFGLLFGLVFGALAAYCLLKRILYF